jgi:hypothetical protein
VSVHNLLEAFVDVSFTNDRAQTPVPWQGAKGGEFNCNNKSGEFQNIGVGRRSRLCMFIFSHPAFHAGFYMQGSQDPDTCLVINNVP